jgi:hypothetical protein
MQLQELLVEDNFSLCQVPHTVHALAKVVCKLMIELLEVDDDQVGAWQ